MLLSEETIQENFNTFLSILEPVVNNRPGADWAALRAKLVTSDFSTAPASTKYHASYRGGLVDHSLNVYYNLCSLVKNKHLEEKISSDSIAIVALLHDFSKINTYVLGARNVKVYSDTGSKSDEIGRFDWHSELAYTTKPEDERFLFGNHEETSEFMIRTYIPLTYEESIAVLNHHGGMGYDSCQGNVASKAMARYNLTTLLHVADMLATYIDEQETK